MGSGKSSFFDASITGESHLPKDVLLAIDSALNLTLLSKRNVEDESSSNNPIFTSTVRSLAK